MATLTVRGSSWVLSWHDARGQHRKTIGRTDSMSKREAERVLKAKEYELAANTQVLDLGTGRMERLGVVFEAYMLWRAAAYPRSQDQVRKKLVNELAKLMDKPASHLDGKWLSAWVVESLKTRNSRTVTILHSYIKAMLRWAAENGYDVDKKALVHKPPKVVDNKTPVFFTPEQLQAIYKANPDRAPMWRFIANTGLRCGEAIRLERADVRRNTVHIISSSRGSTKSGRSRTVPLSPGAREAYEVLAKREGRLFRTECDVTLSAWFKADAKAAGIDAHLHQLRHTFASTLVMQGVPIATVQRLLGHAKIETTMVYAHLSEEHILSSVNNLTI